jgi:hypothetical protein
MSESKWTWSFGRGISWALPVGAGSLFGVRDALARSVAFGGDWSPLLLVFAAFGLALWLGGLRRVPGERALQEDDIRKRVEALSKDPKRGGQ